jgi:hypothetical protein
MKRDHFRDGYRLASQGLQALLAMEVPAGTTDASP